MKYLICLVVLVLISCSNDDLSPTSSSNPNEIYIAGFTSHYFYDGYRKIASYWKNNEKHELPGGLVESYATSIFVSGNDVFVAGVVSDVDHIYLPALWKNGVLTALPMPDNVGTSTSSWVNKLVVNGDDVYIAGVLYDNFVGNVSSTAVLWKNGQLIPLNNSSNNCANSISFFGQDVYVGGDGGYWKNGTFNEVKEAVSINSIIVSGENLFLAGRFSNSDKQLVGGYKKNDLDFVPLPHPNFLNASVVSMGVMGDDVYFTGALFNDSWSTAKNTTVLWKNNSIVSVLDIGLSNPSSISLYKNEVFIAGISGGDQYTGVYWINNKRVQISECASANDIFVR